MHFRLISDLHIDINGKLQRDMHFDPNAFYLIAGDISGDRIQTTDFLISKNISGAFVEGNHFGYNETADELKDTKQESNKILTKVFTDDFQLTFLENKMIEVNDCIIVGGTLYTDFNLFNNKDLSTLVASKYLNDFRYVKVLDKGNKIRRVNTTDYEKWFSETIAFIDYVCKANPFKKVVVLTHHAPSIQSVSPEYKEDRLSSAYASNLEQFILDRPNIVAWCHGHVHSKADYMIGQCRVLAEPFGYYNENAMDLKNYLGLEFEV